MAGQWFSLGTRFPPPIDITEILQNFDGMEMIRNNRISLCSHSLDLNAACLVEKQQIPILLPLF
jgi:hypothetical protein